MHISAHVSVMTKANGISNILNVFFSIQILAFFRNGHSRGLIFECFRDTADHVHIRAHASIMPKANGIFKYSQCFFVYSNFSVFLHMDIRVD